MGKTTDPADLAQDSWIPAVSIASSPRQELWRACCAIRGNFVTSYVGYHHLKAKASHD